MRRSPWGRRESDTTERLNNNNVWLCCNLGSIYLPNDILAAPSFGSYG